MSGQNNLVMRCNDVPLEQASADDCVADETEVLEVGTDPLYVFSLLIKRPHLIFHWILALYWKLMNLFAVEIPNMMGLKGTGCHELNVSHGRWKFHLDYSSMHAFAVFCWVQHRCLH